MIYLTYLHIYVNLMAMEKTKKKKKVHEFKLDKIHLLNYILNRNK